MKHMFESLKHIRSYHDIRVEKARMRYEALLAENKMMESFSAAGQAVSLITSVRRFSAGFHQAYAVATRITDFFRRLFGRSKKEPSSEEETTVYTE